MATVYRRISNYCKNSKMPILGIEDRSVIGKLVANTYRSKFGKLPKKRTLSIEQGGKFNVQYYPAEFIPEMDRIIRMQSQILLQSKKAVAFTNQFYNTSAKISRGYVPHGKCRICNINKK